MKTNTQLFFHAGGKFILVTSFWKSENNKYLSLRCFYPIHVKLYLIVFLKRIVYVGSLFLRCMFLIHWLSMHHFHILHHDTKALENKKCFKINSHIPKNSNACLLSKKKSAQYLPHSILCHGFITCTIIKTVRRGSVREWQINHRVSINTAMLWSHHH